MNLWQTVKVFLGLVFQIKLSSIGLLSQFCLSQEKETLKFCKNAECENPKWNKGTSTRHNTNAIHNLKSKRQTHENHIVHYKVIMFGSEVVTAQNEDEVNRHITETVNECYYPLV